jgi:DNA anti-recombination protein RmuC
MCSHGHIQNQLTEIQNQISTLYNAITKIVMKQKKTEDNLEDVVAMLNDLFQDSQEIQNNFLETSNEKDN